MINTWRRILQFRHLPIRVHGWGGFGSQIFTFLTAERLRKIFPHRRIVLVFHSSGVTKRPLELPPEILMPYSVHIVDDFKHGSDISESRKLVTPLDGIRKKVFSVLASVGFSATLNNNKQYINLSPWLISVRGHYSDISLSENEIIHLTHLFRLGSNSFENQGDFALSIHYRLGDLLNLSSKSYIPAKRIVEVIDSLTDNDSLDLYSDSAPNEISKIFEGSKIKKTINLLSLDSPLVIKRCVESRYFVGTNSKISLLIAIVRFYNKQGKDTWIVYELAPKLQLNLSEIEKREPLNYF